MRTLDDRAVNCPYGHPPRKINLIISNYMSRRILIKIFRTDTTLDLSQKAEKGMNFQGLSVGSCTFFEMDNVVGRTVASAQNKLFSRSIQIYGRIVRVTCVRRARAEGPRSSALLCRRTGG
jgi:hypothetical protein